MDEENLDVEEMDVEYINKEYSDDGDDGEDIEEDHIIGIVDLTEDVEENVFIEKDDAEDKESLHIIDLGNLDEDVEEIEDEQDTEEQLKPVCCDEPTSNIRIEAVWTQHNVTVDEARLKINTDPVNVNDPICKAATSDSMQLVDKQPSAIPRQNLGTSGGMPSNFVLYEGRKLIEIKRCTINLGPKIKLPQSVHNPSQVPTHKTSLCVGKSYNKWSEDKETSTQSFQLEKPHCSFQEMLKAEKQLEYISNTKLLQEKPAVKERLGDFYFQCQKCRFSCLRRVPFFEHIQSHNKERFTCGLCSNNVEKMDNYIKHVKTSHLTNQVFFCPHCTFCSMNLTDFIKHYKLHETKHCPRCTFATINLMSFLFHMKMHELNMKVLHCIMCCFKTRFNYYRGKHFFEKHRPNLHPDIYNAAKKGCFRQFFCDKCSFKTESLELFERHRDDHLRLDKDQTLGSTGISIDEKQEDQIVASRTEALQQNSNEVTTNIEDESNLFYCTICKFKSYKIRSIYRHLHKAHNTKGGIRDSKISRGKPMKSPGTEESNGENGGSNGNGGEGKSLKMTKKNSKTLLCTKCNFKAASKIILKQHFLSSHKSRSNSTSSGSEITSLERKINRVHTCVHCSSTYKLPQNLHRHIQAVHGTSNVLKVNGKLVKCSKCKIQSQSMNAQRLHHRIGHASFALRTLICKVCDQRFDHIRHLQRHEGKHKEKKLTCDVCTVYKTYRKDLLQRHKNKCKLLAEDIEEVKEEECMTCGECNYIARDLAELSQHMKCHGLE